MTASGDGWHTRPMRNPKSLLTALIAGVAMLAVTAPAASAAVDMWATFGPNTGSPTANVTRTTLAQRAPAGNTIDIENLSFSITAGTSKPTVSNITFTKKVDLNTPALMVTTLNRQTYASVKITVAGTNPANGEATGSSKVYCAERAYVASVSNRIDDETGEGGFETVSLKILGEIHVGVRARASILNPFNILSYDLTTNLSGFPNNGCQIP